MLIAEKLPFGQSAESMAACNRLGKVSAWIHVRMIITV